MRGDGNQVEGGEGGFCGEPPPPEGTRTRCGVVREDCLESVAAGERILGAAGRTFL